MIVLLPLLLTSVDVGGVVHRARSAVEFEKEVAEARAATARHEPQLALELWQRLAQRVSWHSERDDVGMRQYADVLRGLRLTRVCGRLLLSAFYRAGTE